jgi:hypothetical protein
MVGTTNLFEGKNPSLNYALIYYDVWHTLKYREENEYIGGWQDPDNKDRYCVDKSVWVETFGAARTIAAEFKQTYIYNIATGKSIAIHNKA